jgi:hypothetical protein
MKPDFRAAALDYARIGWRTFPLGEGVKLPAIKGGHGVKEASLIPEDIEAWAKRFPHANIGIACGLPSGIVVIDIDPRNGGSESLAKHAARGHILPPGPIAKTGNGGFHHFFKMQPGVTNSKNRLGSGVDLKSTGGYVVGSGSWIEKTKDGPGGVYTWLTSPFQTSIPRLPIWVASLLNPPKKPDGFASQSQNFSGSDSLNTLARWAAKGVQGGRNNGLFWAACRAAEAIRQHKISAGEAERALLRSAMATGLDQKEALATIHSAFNSVKGTH